MALMELDTAGNSVMAFDTEADEFVIFTNELFDRAFDKLEDAQDEIWLKSVNVPDFDW
jgi:hypothetical protein